MSRLQALRALSLALAVVLFPIGREQRTVQARAPGLDDWCPVINNNYVYGESGPCQTRGGDGTDCQVSPPFSSQQLQLQGLPGNCGILCVQL